MEVNDAHAGNKWAKVGKVGAPPRDNKQHMAKNWIFVTNLLIVFEKILTYHMFVHIFLCKSVAAVS